MKSLAWGGLGSVLLCGCTGTSPSAIPPAIAPTPAVASPTSAPIRNDDATDVPTLALSIHPWNGRFLAVDLPTRRPVQSIAPTGTGQAWLLVDETTDADKPEHRLYRHDGERVVDTITATCARPRDVFFAVTVVDGSLYLAGQREQPCVPR